MLFCIGSAAPQHCWSYPGFSELQQRLSYLFCVLLTLPSKFSFTIRNHSWAWLFSSAWWRRNIKMWNAQKSMDLLPPLVLHPKAQIHICIGTAQRTAGFPWWQTTCKKMEENVGHPAWPSQVCYHQIRNRVSLAHYIPCFSSAWKFIFSWKTCCSFVQLHYSAKNMDVMPTPSFWWNIRLTASPWHPILKQTVIMMCIFSTAQTLMF